MKLQGVVIDYNGYDGIIETYKKDKYVLLKEEIVDEVVLKKLDHVMFIPEKSTFDDIEFNIARFVRKLDKTNHNNLNI